MVIIFSILKCCRKCSRKYRLSNFNYFVAQAELVRQISCLPIRTDTLTMRNKKQELDRKLAEVEEAIKIFSRPKVFIKMDS